MTSYNMPPFLSVLVFIISILFLSKSGAVIVTQLSGISRFLRLSEFAVSFIVIAFATSLPDLFVGISSALHGKPELSFANIVGANMVTLTLAAGIPVLFGRGILVESAIVRKDSIYAGLLAIFPIFLLLDGVLSKVDGVVLIAMNLWYFINVLYQREKFTKIFKHKNGKKNPAGLSRMRQSVRDFSILFIAIAVLLISAEGVIRSALSMTASFNISVSFVGMFVVAISITMPEIVFGIRAILKKHEGMVLGNLIGSVIINSGLVVGLTAVISPIYIYQIDGFFVGAAFTAIIALLFPFFTFSDRRISMLEGLSLIGIYLIFGALTLIIDNNGL